MDLNVNIRHYIDNCLLRKLTKSLDETEIHPEFAIRLHYLEQNFNQLIDSLINLDHISKSSVAPLLPQLYILIEELKTDGPWNTEKCKQYLHKLNSTFDKLYGTTLENILQNDVFNAQEVFDECVKVLHEKLTSDSYRYYPSLVEVYCSLAQKPKDLNVFINASSILPISLLLMDDYSHVNKIKGLKCCLTILQCLNANNFIYGNYYEVICAGLTKSATEKNIQSTNLVLKCFLQLLDILPADVKKTKVDYVFATILEQLYLESNLYRKAMCFMFTKTLIQIHGVNCVKSKVFKNVVCDNLDICSNETVADILLLHVLECLEEWVQHSWCIWRLSSDQKVLSSLLKMLYLCKKEHVVKIQNLILTLISLCTKDERKKIYTNLTKPPQLPNVEFLQRIEEIKRDIIV